MLACPKFIDQHPPYNNTGYFTTNEELAIFTKFLKGVKVNKAACIASGGEFLLTVLLNRASEIFAVDHSYRALSATYYKLLLLQKRAGNRIKQDLFIENYKPFTKHVADLWQHMPEKLNKDTWRNEQSDRYSLESIRKSWYNLTFPRITAEAVGKVTLIHGDLTDVTNLAGPVDMLYISNAMEHSNRERKYPSFETIAPLLNPGGFLLLSKSYHMNEFSYGYKSEERDALFTKLKSVRGIYSTAWVYEILRKK